MTLKFLGTGTSHGIPVIGCDCPVCSSTDFRDQRNRCSVYVSSPTKIVIDTGPEFRIQALKFGIKSLDTVLLTHGHADHLNGLDDLRVFSHTKSFDPSSTQKETEGNGLPIYANSKTLADIKNRFDYIFTPVTQGGGKPKLFFVDSKNYSLENPIEVDKMKIVPVPLMHGKLPTTGWILKEDSRGSIAYLTDCSSIPEESFEILKQSGPIHHLVIDALREKPHSTHFSFLQAMEASERIGAKHTWFTHLSHSFSHLQANEYIKNHLNEFPNLFSIAQNGGSIEAAYDGLEIET